MTMRTGNAPSNIITAAVAGGDLLALKPPGVPLTYPCPRCGGPRPTVHLASITPHLYQAVCARCAVEVEVETTLWRAMAPALPAPTVVDWVYEVVMEEHARMATYALPPGPVAAVMPVPVPPREDEVARQRVKKCRKRNGHGQLIKRNRRAQEIPA